tara:strand:- start:46 stop:450 length:405 start_codon:yes stop_codon:yes gene_type:complete
MDKRTYLKVKIKSLAAEALIIRTEERRAYARGRTALRMGLQDHRKGIVRTESRHTHLAYGFIRGRDYHQMESSTHETPNWEKVRKMVDRYGAYVVWDSSSETYDDYRKRQQEHKEEARRLFDAWLAKAKETTSV